MRSPGNTPGGMNLFLIGVLITLSSGMSLFGQIQKIGGFFAWFGDPGWTFVAILVAMFVGMATLFFLGINVVGMSLALGGLLVVILGVLIHIGVHAREGSLWTALLGTFGMFAGVGMVSRSVLPIEPPKSQPKPPDPSVN